ncbi:MAG: DUF2336 domain-containing protein [Sphingomicrobium sp.]
MTPEEWPLAAQAADEIASARGAGGDRLGTIVTDFFLPPEQRLTEQERALMTAMLDCLVGDIAAELRARLPVGLGAANDDAQSALVDTLSGAGLFDRPRLIALLARRADEERIALGARFRTGRRDARAVQALVSHEDGEVASAAMAVIVARGKRRDRYGQCMVAIDDLSPPLAETLVPAIAAALSRQLPKGSAPGEVDGALAQAADGVLAERDPDSSVDALTGALVRLLDQRGLLDDQLILAAASEGEIAFVAHGLARGAGIAGETALDELLCGDSEQLIMFFRSAGASRQLSAGILAAVGDLIGIADPGSALDRFDRIGDQQAAAGQARLASPPAYRRALAALEGRYGKRSV